MLDFEVKVMYQKKSELTRELKLWRSRERHVSTRDREQKFPLGWNSEDANYTQHAACKDLGLEQVGPVGGHMEL